MNIKTIAMIGAGTLVLVGCASKDNEIASTPPPPPGAIAGTVAADQNGDGIVDGYYTSDGIYHAYAAPLPPPPPPPPPSSTGERG